MRLRPERTCNSSFQVTLFKLSASNIEFCRPLETLQIKSKLDQFDNPSTVCCRQSYDNFRFSLIHETPIVLVQVRPSGENGFRRKADLDCWYCSSMSSHWRIICDSNTLLTCVIITLSCVICWLGCLSQTGNGVTSRKNAHDFTDKFNTCLLTISITACPKVINDFYRFLLTESEIWPL